MKAAVVTNFDQPLEIQDVPIPKPGHGEVLVKVETSGLCHTDIHAAHGDWPVKPRRRSFPAMRASASSSASGRASRYSAKATGWLCPGWDGLVAPASSAHRVGKPYARTPATRATASTADSPNTSWPRRPSSGRVPDAIDPLDAAPLTCAGVTTYKAVKVSGARSSDLVAVFGIGGLGHLAVQYARSPGRQSPPST